MSSIFRKFAEMFGDRPEVVTGSRFARNVLMIDHSIPDETSDAGSYAAIQEMKLMQSLGCQITFLPWDMTITDSAARKLEVMGVRAIGGTRKYNFETLLTEELAQADVVYVTRFGVAEVVIPIVKKRNPGIPILFNNADLHFLREMRALPQREMRKGLLKQVLDIRRRELAVCSRVDAVLCYTAAEHAVISSHLHGRINLQLTPWVIDLKDLGPPHEARSGIAFLGNFQHQPNREAVVHFIENVMPLLTASRSDIVLHIYGSNMSDDLAALASANVSVEGYVENLDDVFHRHRGFVAPLLSGAGIKGKVLEAMSYGTPVALSEIAAEGTGLVDQVSAFVCETGEEYVAAIISFYDDADVWEALRTQARLIAAHRYSSEHGRKRFRRIFESVGLQLVP